ncbi:MAG: T9SS type A sorting domain-containing protein [Candidatus Cloacimonetes bacterium]|nr:T9SS type A sorting domain-containing protein [Candidatus Cloacimonadota bacterium]
MRKYLLPLFIIIVFIPLAFAAVPTIDAVGGSNTAGGGTDTQDISAGGTIYFRAETSDVETGHYLSSVHDGTVSGFIYLYFWSQTPNSGYAGFVDHSQASIDNFANSSNNYCTFDVILPGASSIPVNTTYISFYFGLMQTNNPPPPFANDFGDAEASYYGITSEPTGYYGYMNYASDTTTLAPTLDLPEANQIIPQDFTVQYDQPEAAYAGSVKLTITRTSGSADSGSPHILEITSEAAGTDKILLIKGANMLSGSGIEDIVSGGNSLVNNAVYTVKIEYQDLAQNGVAFDSNAGIIYELDSYLAITGGDYNAGTSFSPGSINNAFFRIQMQQIGSGLAKILDKIKFDITGSFQASDIDNLKIWRSTDSSFNSGSDVLLVTETNNLDPFEPDFNPDENIGTTPIYYFLTVDVTSTASGTDEIGASINTAADVTVNCSVSGSFPISGSTHPLPVTLTSFTVDLSNQPVINWVTETETNNAYWNIYRSISQNIGQAIQINEDDIIPGQGTVTEPTYYVYTDDYPLTANTTYWYWLECIDNAGEAALLGPVSLFVPEGGDNEGTPATPDDYGLKQNYPNPFNPSTSINFALEENSPVRLTIYNVKGEKVKTVFEDYVPADLVQTANWDGRDEAGKSVASGVYLYRLRTNKTVYSKRMLLLK